MKQFLYYSLMALAAFSTASKAQSSAFNFNINRLELQLRKLSPYLYSEKDLFLNSIADIVNDLPIAQSNSDREALSVRLGFLELSHIFLNEIKTPYVINEILPSLEKSRSTYARLVAAKHPICLQPRVLTALFRSLSTEHLPPGLNEKLKMERNAWARVLAKLRGRRLSEAQCEQEVMARKDSLVYWQSQLLQHPRYHAFAVVLKTLQ